MKWTSIAGLGALLLAGLTSAGGQPWPGAGQWPERGAVSIQPAKRWEDALVTGNGRMGAMLYGQPLEETVVGNHGRLFLPLGSREIVPELGRYLPEVRRLIKAQGYTAAHRFME